MFEETQRIEALALDMQHRSAVTGLGAGWGQAGGRRTNIIIAIESAELLSVLY